MMCSFLLNNNANQLRAYVYSLLPERPSRPPPPTLPGHHRARSWALISVTAPSHQLSSHSNAFMSVLLSAHPTPSFPTASNGEPSSAGSWQSLSPTVWSLEKALNKCLSWMKKKAFSIVIKSQTFWVTPSEALLFSCPTASHNDPNRRTSGSHVNVCDKAKLTTFCATYSISGAPSLSESYSNVIIRTKFASL